MGEQAVEVLSVLGVIGANDLFVGLLVLILRGTVAGYDGAKEDEVRPGEVVEDVIDSEVVGLGYASDDRPNTVVSVSTSLVGRRRFTPMRKVVMPKKSASWKSLISSVKRRYISAGDR